MFVARRSLPFLTKKFNPGLFTNPIATVGNKLHIKQAFYLRTFSTVANNSDEDKIYIPKKISPDEKVHPDEVLLMEGEEYPGFLISFAQFYLKVLLIVIGGASGVFLLNQFFSESSPSGRKRSIYPFVHQRVMKDSLNYSTTLFDQYYELNKIYSPETEPGTSLQELLNSLVVICDKINGSKKLEQVPWKLHLLESFPEQVLFLPGTNILKLIHLFFTILINYIRWQYFY